jgi:hypothetical protein
MHHSPPSRIATWKQFVRDADVTAGLNRQSGPHLKSVCGMIALPTLAKQPALGAQRRTRKRVSVFDPRQPAHQSSNRRSTAPSFAGSVE